MDMFGNRAALLASLDRVVSISSNHFRAAEAGQMSLFGAAWTLASIARFAQRTLNTHASTNYYSSRTIGTGH